MKHNKVAFVFAGQGAQKVGMGADFYALYPEAKLVFDQVDSTIKTACFNGPQEVLNNTLITQQALLVYGVAVAKVLESFNIKADICAGLSLGEYSALTYAKSLKVKDALQVVKRRSEIMSQALYDKDTTMMAVLNVSISDIKKVIDQASCFGICEIANFNSPTQTVLTGNKQALSYAKEKLQYYPKARVIPLSVTGAFHSSYLKDASDDFFDVLKTVEMSKPSIDVVFNTTATIEYENINELLKRQLYSSVHWLKSIETMIHHGVDTFIEISPKPIIKGFIRQIDPDLWCECVSDESSLHNVLEALC